MDAVMGRLQQMGDTQTGGSIAALGLCNRSENGRSSELAGAVLASSYAETLRGWDMPVARSVVAKRAFSWCGMDLLHDFKEGSRSKTFTIGPATSGRDISSVKCSICRLKVGASFTPHATHHAAFRSWAQLPCAASADTPAILSTFSLGSQGILFVRLWVAAALVWASGSSSSISSS